MKNLLSALMLCFLTSPLWAASITNQELIKACKDKKETSQHFCYGFIIATANAAQFYRNIADVTDEYLDICFPTDITNKTLVEDYLAWGEKNLNLATSPAFLGVSSAFSVKYSCPEKKKEESESST